MAMCSTPKAHVQWEYSIVLCKKTMNIHSINNSVTAKVICRLQNAKVICGIEVAKEFRVRVRIISHLAQHYSAISILEITLSMPQRKWSFALMEV